MDAQVLPAPMSKCQSCPTHRGAALQRLGINMANWDHVVALMGNPNTGKSTVFNALTGLRQHTGNWPGKTVARAEGGFRHDGKTYKIVDLPGTYSLISSNSADEEVARDFLLFASPDVTVVVADATRLERNLILVLQVLEITPRVVVALNLMDEARRMGLEIDVRTLTRHLGVPVVPMAARRNEGISDLLQAIHDVARGEFAVQPHTVERLDVQLEALVEQLVPVLEANYPHLPNLRWVALRLLDNDASITSAIADGTLGEINNPGEVDLPVLAAAS